MTLVVISHRPEVWNFGDKVIEMAAGVSVTSERKSSGEAGFA